MGFDVCNVPQTQREKQDVASNFVDAMIRIIETKNQGGLSPQNIYNLIENWTATGQAYISLTYIDQMRAIWIRKSAPNLSGVKPSQQLLKELKDLTFHLQRNMDQKVIREKFFRAQDTLKGLIWGFNYLYEKTYPKDYPNHQSKMLQIQEFSAKKQWAAAPCNQHI